MNAAGVFFYGLGLLVAALLGGVINQYKNYPCTLNVQRVLDVVFLLCALVVVGLVWVYLPVWWLK